MSRATVVDERVVPWLGISLLVLDDGTRTVEVPGLVGHEHGDYSWAYGESFEETQRARWHRYWQPLLERARAFEATQSQHNDERGASLAQCQKESVAAIA